MAGCKIITSQYAKPVCELLKREDRAMNIEKHIETLEITNLRLKDMISDVEKSDNQELESSLQYLRNAQRCIYEAICGLTSNG